MATGTFSYSATVDPGDTGGTRTISGAAVLDVASVAEGTYTATTTYDTWLGQSVTNFLFVAVFNTGLEDLSLRVDVDGVGNNYQFYTIIPGGVFVVPERFGTMSISPTALGIRCALTTCTFDYLIVR